MSHSFGRGRGALKSRLPPIHMLGRHTPVDEDEPPDVSVQAFGFEESDGEHPTSSVFETTFDSSDAEDSSKYMRKAFNILQPGYHAAKRMPDMEGGYFSHCPRGVPLGRQYSNLRRLMEERAQLEIFKDCLIRVKSAQSFVEELENLVQLESKTVYLIRHGYPMETPVTKLYCLNALCEDLRLHVAHWNSIKQRLNTNRWLQPRLGQLCLQLQHIMQVLTALVLRSVCSLDQLIHLGFEVFAYGNVESLTPEVIWNITRGLEDFNIIVNGLKLHFQVDKSLTFGVHHFLLPSTNSSSVVTSALTKPLRIIPFHKILNILANERSKYAAKLTHQFFTQNEHFLRMLAAGKFPGFEWDDYLPNQSQPHSVMVRSDTGDYQTITGSSASLNATFIKMGSLRAPDLSNLASPLLHFSQKEQEFAESFLLVVCNSTSLLRKKEPQKARQSHRGSKHPTSKNPLSPVVGRPPKAQGQGETPVLTRTDSQRKTVSWGDNADNSIRSAVVDHYMDTLWTHMGRNLDLFLDEPAWRGHNCLLKSEIGSVLLFNDSVSAVLRNMIEHLCYKDLFSPSSVKHLLGVVFRLLALSSYGAWDMLLNTSLASETSDKCQPVSLYGDLFSTRTGCLIKDMYKPLVNILMMICRCFPKDKDDELQHADVDLSVCAGVIWRILITCKLATSWCTSKLQQSLSSWNVNHFFLISHCDLKMLVDSTKNICFILQTLNLVEDHMGLHVFDSLSLCQIFSLKQQISSINGQIQALTGTAMKNFLDKYNEQAVSFFQENLLPARIWKKKVAPDESADPSNYITEGIDTFLASTINGISKLSTTSQIGVLSLMTGTFCNAWISFILKEKIKFSLWGAVQLGIDFDFLRYKLSQLLTNDEVKQSITELGIFQQMQGIVILLKRQPSQKQSGSRLMDNIMCDTAVSALSSDQCSDTRLSGAAAVAVRNGSHKMCKLGPLTSQEEENVVCTVPNMQEWLSLRAIGGSKPWKFPACFSRSSSDD
ncbi:hypothetical protein BgiMline_002609 [Biomphalaria glabrata]|nr:CAunnamed protein product [Biomphalaria glabrata]